MVVDDDASIKHCASDGETYFKNGTYVKRDFQKILFSVPNNNINKYNFQQTTADAYGAIYII